MTGKCIFCEAETVIEETKKSVNEFCEKCKCKIVRKRMDNAPLAVKFPRRDKFRTLIYFAPILVALLYVLFEESESVYLAAMPLRGLIIFAAIMVYCSVMNLISFRKRGYFYLGINRVVKRDDKPFFLRITKITTWVIILLGIFVMVRMSLMI